MMLLVLALLIDRAHGAQCLTHSQARAAYGFNLRWTGDGQGRRCWGVAFRNEKTGSKRNPPPEATKSSEPKTASSLSSEGPTWVFEDSGVKSGDFTPLRMVSREWPEIAGNATGDIRAKAQNHASSDFPVSVTGLLLILLMSGLLTAYKLGKEAWGHYASRRVPGDRTGGSRSRDRLLWLLLGQEPGGRQRRTRPP
jgi:hypothetical protein